MVRAQEGEQEQIQYFEVVLDFLFCRMFYLYILYSVDYDKYYIGSSQDPWERLVWHNDGQKDTFTSKYRPWQLAVVFEAGLSRAEALYFERFVKKQKSRIFLEKLIDPDFVPNGKIAKLVRVPHLRD